MDVFSLTAWQAVSIAIGILSTCVGIGIWIGATGQKVKSNTNGLEKVNEHLYNLMEKINSNLINIFDRLPSATVSSASPAKLTELGEIISKEINAKDWARRIYSNLDMKMAYWEDHEIHEWCFEYVRNSNNLSPAMLLDIPKIAYEHGISRDDVTSVLAIVLRDLILASKNKRTWTAE